MSLKEANSGTVTRNNKTHWICFASGVRDLMPVLNVTRWARWGLVHPQAAARSRFTATTELRACYLQQLGRYTYPFPYVYAPQPPTEFQRLVYESVGQQLKIFGSNLFLNVPTTFAPLDRAPVPSDYVIGPGDQLIIRGWGQVDINVRATVDRGWEHLYSEGRRSRSDRGEVQRTSSLPQGRNQPHFQNFDLSVSMGQLRSIQIFVVGQARRPGTYTVSSLSTLVNAAFHVGRPVSTRVRCAEFSCGEAIAVVVEFDLYDLLIKGDKSKDVTLLPGDVIFIPPVGAQVAIVGSVNTPSNL